MKKSLFFFLLSISILPILGASDVFAQNQAAPRRGVTSPGGAYMGNYGMVQDVVVSDDEPMVDDDSRIMILPYQTDIAPASPSARPLLARVSAKTQEQRDLLQAQREARREAREEQLKSMNRPKRAQERMSDVAKRVQEILANQEAKGGIGLLVREVAQAQNEKLATLSANLEQVEARQGLAKWLLGSDRKALLNVKKEATEIDSRIAQLESGLDLLAENDRELALDLIEELKAQRAELLSVVEEKETEFSVSGWLRKLFGQAN